jgi:hypothetical protein
MKCPHCNSPMSFFTVAEGLTEYVFGCGSRLIVADGGGKMDSQSQTCIKWADLRREYE